eukprot:g1280.t1
MDEESNTTAECNIQPPKQYGHLRVDINELSFIESEMHTLVNSTLNEICVANFWARIGFVENDDVEKNRLERYWPPVVSCPIYTFAYLAENRKQWMISRSAYQSILKEDDTLQTAQRKVGEMNLIVGDNKNASIALSAATTLDPTDSTALYLLTKAYINLKDFETSRKIYQQALKCEQNCFNIQLKNDVMKSMEQILSL